MDLLTGMFDGDVHSKRLCHRIKRNDPTLARVVVNIATDPRESDQSITAAVDIVQLGRDIGKNTSVKDLLLDDLHCLDHTDVFFTSNLFNMLCNGILDNKSIEQLTVSNFSDNQWRIGQLLGPFLENNPNLRSVCLMTGGGYTRSAENMRLLVEPLLKRNDPLDELCLIESGVDDDMVIALVDVFYQNPKLVPKQLQIAACEFGLRGCEALAKLLKNAACSMETLDIPDNYIGDDGAACLADAVKGNHKLKLLSLEGNQITDKGWKLFANVPCHVRRQHEGY